MIRFLLHAIINLVTVALGLLIASWLIPGVTLQPAGFTVAVLVFALAQGILGPFVFNVARQYASPILGGIGLVTTLIALFIASFFDGGLQIRGVSAWVLGTLIVWIVTALGGWILGAIFLKKRSEQRKA
ncbi:phage holin family protein [Arthrobacter sp. 260]|uniref:phage holin family protein n=1 Tax=Arthrobacter sp. 260 TaxID=2735314 RepID=UPI0014925506|nr:phage holin family protein [Arthrobacter sp. 260]NOJ59178.1 phage holin family protein [Arthrobacter sp. 260]